MDNYVIIRDWLLHEKGSHEELEEVLLEVEKLDPTIRQRWKPNPESWYHEQIFSLIEAARLPEGFDLRSTSDASFAIVALVTGIKLHDAVKQHYPNETFSEVLDQTERWF